MLLEDEFHEKHFAEHLREKAAERLASGNSRVFSNPFLLSKCAALPHLAKKEKKDVSKKEDDEKTTEDDEKTKKEAAETKNDGKRKENREYSIQYTGKT